MVETCSVLSSSNVRLPYGTNQRPWGLPRSDQERPKGPKTVKSVIFKGDGSLDALFTRLWERLMWLWTSHMSGYFMEPIKDNEDLKGAVRNVNNGQKRLKLQKETTVLTCFFKVNRRNWRFSGLLTCQGTFWSQSETMKTSKELSGTSITAKNGHRGKLGLFKEDGSLDLFFSR